MVNIRIHMNNYVGSCIRDWNKKLTSVCLFKKLRNEIILKGKVSHYMNKYAYELGQ